MEAHPDQQKTKRRPSGLGGRTSGVSAASGFSRMSQRTSTDVSGLMAMPACMPCSWMYRISSLGFVCRSDRSAGFSAADDSTAAS